LYIITNRPDLRSHGTKL